MGNQHNALLEAMVSLVYNGGLSLSRAGDEFMGPKCSLNVSLPQAYQRFAGARWYMSFDSTPFKAYSFPLFINFFVVKFSPETMMISEGKEDIPPPPCKIRKNVKKMYCLKLHLIPFVCMILFDSIFILFFVGHKNGP